MKAVACDGVSFSYANSPAVLENVTFNVEEGEFVGIIGPNGSGKTTLFKLLMGFLKPSSGTLKVFEQSPDIALRELAYVPQTLSYDRLFPISVLELVLTGLLSHLTWWGAYHPEDKKRALAALDRVGLLPLKDAPFGTLSGGQAQRALIARALVSMPRLLLLDEPTANVDTKAVAEIYALLHGLKGKMTIMMITHDLNAVIGEVERVLCLQKGVLSLLPEQVCEHFALGVYHEPLQISKGT